MGLDQRLGFGFGFGFGGVFRLLGFDLVFVCNRFHTFCLVFSTDDVGFSRLNCVLA